MLGLVHGGPCHDGRSGGVAFGGFGAAFQLGLFQLGLPLSDLLNGDRPDRRERAMRRSPVGGFDGGRIIRVGRAQGF